MTTLTFTLETNEQLILEHLLRQDHSRLAMYTALDALHTEAENNGLTDEMIEELLADES